MIYGVHVAGWLGWLLAALALTGLWAWLDKALKGGYVLADWWQAWRAARAPVLGEDVGEGEEEIFPPACEDLGCVPGGPHFCEPLPPEQSAADLGFSIPPEQSQAPFIIGETGGRPVQAWVVDETGPLSYRRERRMPWWEAEARSAHEALGFDFPSGLVARVREAVR